MKLKSISPSRIKTWWQCRFKYYMNYVLGLKLKSNWGAAHGTLIHDLLEAYASKEDLDWMRRLYAGYAGKLETVDNFGNDIVMETPLVWAKEKEFANMRPVCDTCRFRNDEDGICGISHESLDALTGCPKGLFEDSIKMMEGVLRRYNPLFKDDSRILATEYGIKLPIPDASIKLIGFMDLVIERDPETIEIIDYKSGVWKQNYDECLADIQVRTYSWAGHKIFVEDADNKGYHYKNVLLTFDYFRAQPITLALSADDNERTAEEIAAVAKEIQEATFVNRCVKDPSTFWKCKVMCDVKVCAEQWKGNFHADME